MEDQCGSRLFRSAHDFRDRPDTISGKAHLSGAWELEEQRNAPVLYVFSLHFWPGALVTSVLALVDAHAVIAFGHPAADQR